MATRVISFGTTGKNDLILYGIERAASLTVGFILLSAGAAHLNNPFYLLTRVVSYELVAPRVALAMALLLPSVQIVLGTCLVCRLLPVNAQLAAALLIATFIMAQAAALFRGLRIDCGCFGPAAPQVIGPQSIVRTAGLCVVATVSCLCAYLRSKRARE